MRFIYAKLIYVILFFLFILGFQHTDAQIIAGIRLNGVLIPTGDTVKICKNRSSIYVYASSGATSLNWNFQGGNPGNSTSFGSINVVYNSTGIFLTKQIASNTAIVDSTFIYVDVSDATPVADFSFSPDNECANVPVIFINNSSGFTVSNWNFGDVTSSTETNPSHQFLNAVGTSGTSILYPVTLTVTNEYGCASIKTSNILVKKIPDASVNNADPGVQSGLFNNIPTFKRCFNQPSYLFQFTNGSTTSTSITEYNIDWNDGSPATILSSWPATTIITHTYPLGNNTMTVKAKGTDGCVGIKTYNVFLGTTPAGGISSPGNTAVCAPQALTFALNNIANNPPGTTYSLTFNDGTPILNFNHPAPSSVTHDFITTSCGTFSSPYNNSFSANLVIGNPCGTTTGTVIPIYVSSKPKAKINISPDSIVCTGTNTAISSFFQGGVVNYLGGTNSECVAANKQVWSIIPSAGWTLTSGTFGSTNGTDNILLWTTGTGILNFNFNTPGIYQVKLLVGNSCGTDTVTRNICVRVPPVAAFTIDNHQSCGQAIANFTNITPAGGCNGNKYTWAVQYIDNLGCGSAANTYQFVNATSAASVNPQIQFNNPGKYIIKLTASINSNFNVCPTSLFTDTFTVKGKPKITINPIAAVCLNNSINPSANVSNCYGTSLPVYAWTFTNGTPSASTDVAPAGINYTVTGTHPVLLGVTNECGTTTATANAIITNLPVANAGPDKSICSGSPTTIGTTAVAGLSYQWSPATGLSSATVAIPNATLTYSGSNTDTTYGYAVTTSAGSNCSNTDSVYITVKKSPVLAVTPASAAICSGDTVKIYASGADNYSWLPVAGLNSNNTDTVFASPATTTTYTVTGSLAASGCAATSKITVTIKPFPNTNAGPDSLVCAGATDVQLTGSPAGGSWSGSNISNNGIFNAQQAGTGAFQQYYTASLNGCSKTDSMVINVILQPVANAGNDTTVCSGSAAFPLSASPAGGTWSGNAQVTGAGLFTPVTPGTVTLTYSYGSGTCKAAATKQINIQPGISNNTIATDQSICTGFLPQPVIGSQPAGGNGTYTYTWQSSTDNSNWTTIAGANTINYTPPLLTVATYYRRLVSTNLCINNASPPIQVKVYQDAKAVFTAAKTTGCNPFVINNATISTTAYPDRNALYKWYGNGVLIGSNNTGVFPGYTINNANDSVLIKLVTTSIGGCKSDSMQQKFYTVESPQPAFTQNNTGGCGPVTVTFANTTPQLNKYTFIWDFGNGITSAAQQPAPVVFPPHPLQADTTYTITLKATGGCDTIRAVKFVTVRSAPKALFTPDKSESCSPMKVSFSNTSRGIGNSYIWNFGDGSPLLSSNAAQVQHTFTAGIKDTFYVKLTATNSCGTDFITYAIVVNPNTIRLDFAINGNNKTGCVPFTVKFINNSSGANIYQWNFGDNTVLTTTKGIDTVMHTYTQAGDFTTTVLAGNTCSDTSDTEKVTVHARPQVAFTALPLVGCTNDTIHFTNQGESNINYNWQFGDSSVSGLINPVKAYTLPGNYRVLLTGSRLYATGTTCSDSAFKNIQINGATASLRYNGGYKCISDNIRFEAVSQNASQYKFFFGDGDSLITATSIVFHQYTRAGTYLPYIYLLAGGCSNKIVAGDSIRVDKTTAGFKSNPQLRCGNTAIQFTDTSYSFFGIRQWDWDFGDGTVSASQHPVKIYTRTGSYTIKLTVTGLSGCTDVISIPVTVTVHNYPVGNILSDTIVCSRNSIPFAALVQSADSIAVYEWNFGNNTTGNGKNANAIYNQPGSYTVRLISRTIYGCADSAYRFIKVNPSPVISAGNDTRICKGQSVPLLVNGGNNYAWLPPQGLSCANCSNPIASPLQTTNYTVGGSNAIGCTAFDTVTVTVIQPLKLSITGKDTICIGDATQLLATGADSYQWSPALGLSSTSIPNPIAKPAFTTPYQLVGYDAFNCFTDTARVIVAVGKYPTVDLGTGATVVAGTPVPFKPVITNGPVKNYNWTPTKDLSCTNCGQPVATINNNITYQLEIENIYGCKASDTISYKVVCDPSTQVFVPNAFTPDGDGLNDVLMVRGKGISTVKYFRIFNRWGQVIFERSNIAVNDITQGWDGKINGVPARPDVYVYMVEVLCTAGSSFFYKGNTTLIR